MRRGGEPGLDAVLADPDVDALLVCTPNLTHPELASAALAAGKHVLVEFPLAPGPDGARALFALARDAERVLHVEHIELLSPSQQAQRARVATLGRPRGGALEFRGASGGWIAEPALAGSPALCALARLHRLVDLFGEARVRAASLEGRPGGYRLRAEFAFADGGGAELVEERGPSLERATRWAIVCEGGVLDDPPPEPRAGLFRADLDVFVARVLDGAPSYVGEDRVLHVLELVREIERRCV